MQSTSGGKSSMEVPEVIVRPISEPLHETGTSAQIPVHPATRTPERKTSHGVLKSNSMRVPRITERRHTLPPRQGSIDEISSSGDSANSIYTRSVKVVCVTTETKEDLTVKLLKEACEKKRLNFEVIPYSEIAFDEVSSTERFLFADIAFVHLLSKEEESKLFLKIGHRRNYGKNVNVVMYQIPANVSEDQLTLTYIKELCIEAGAALLPYYSLQGTSNSSNDMSLDLNNVVVLPSPRSTAAAGPTSNKIEWTSLATEIRRVLNSFKQVANKDVALPIVTEIRDLMKSQKGVNLKTELARLFDEKLKLTRSQLTFETVHLFMMALRECQDYDSMISTFRFVRERNYELSQKEGLLYLYAFALNRRQQEGDRKEALALIELVTEPSADMLCLCGRIYKDLYIESDYESNEYLNNAILWYKKGAELEPSDYAMINLATLLVAAGKSFDTDKDLKRLNNKLSFSIGSQGRLDQIVNYWVVATYFELCVLLDDKQQAVGAAQRMFHLSPPAWYIKSTLHNLKLILTKRAEVSKSSPYSSYESHSSKTYKHVAFPSGVLHKDSCALFDFWTKFFLFVGESAEEAYCEYPVLVIEQVTHATANTAKRSLEFVPATLIIHRGPSSDNAPGPILSFDLLMMDANSTNWQFPSGDLAAVNTYLNDGRCLLMYVNKLDDFQIYFPSEAHRDKLFAVLKSELFPDKNPISAAQKNQITEFEYVKRPSGERHFLGSGAFGKVFKARDKKTGKVFALKEIDLTVALSSSDLERPDQVGSGNGSFQVLRDEIQLHMRLKHPNIVKFLGHQINPNTKKFHIFMEFVNGGSLSNFISTHYPGGLPDLDAANFTNQILDGVIYLHEHEVIHRDIKGANVLVDLKMKDVAVLKIADFGTSKQLSKISNLLNTNMKGTPNFLAPEVIACPRGYTYTADVWSMGCTVIEMISGKIPFHGIDPVFIIFQVGRGTQTPPVPENCSRDAADFIEKCCRLNPEDRLSPKQLKMHQWILNNCKSHSGLNSRASVSGSDSAVSRIAANSNNHVMTKSTSGSFSAGTLTSRSTSVPVDDDVIPVDVDDELNPAKSDETVTIAPRPMSHLPINEDTFETGVWRSAPSSADTRQKASNTSSPIHTKRLPGNSFASSINKSRMRQGNMSGPGDNGSVFEASGISTSYKHIKRKSTDPQEGTRFSLNLFIEQHTDKILSLWIRNTQRLHCENRLHITVDTLRYLLMTFRDFLKSDQPTDEILDNGLETMLELVADECEIREIFNSLHCFCGTVVQLLKDAGDSPSQILLSEAILKPMLDDTFDLLLVKKPDAIASSSSQEEPQSDDNDDHLHDEGLDNIEENSDLGFTPEDYNFHPSPRSSRQVSNRSGGTSGGASGHQTPSHYPRNSYVPNDVRETRSIHSAPNSIGSSGITGSLSAFSAHYLNLAQQTERLERHLAQTQRTLNTLLTIQIQMNQSRIQESVGTMQSYGVDTNTIMEQLNAAAAATSNNSSDAAHPDHVPQNSSNCDHLPRDVSTQCASEATSSRNRMVRMNACEPDAANPLSINVSLETHADSDQPMAL